MRFAVARQERCKREQHSLLQPKSTNWSLKPYFVGSDPFVLNVSISTAGQDAAFVPVNVPAVSVLPLM